MDCSTPGFPVHHQLLELTQTHVHWVGDAIQPSHPLSSPFPPAFNLSQHQGCCFSSSHVWLWESDYKESWALKNRCFWTVVLEKTLESPLNCREIQPVHPKRDQSWVFIGRTDVEVETPILWPPDVKSWLLEKTLMLGKIEGRRRRGRQRIRSLDGITDSMDMSLGGLQELQWTGRPGVLWSMGSQRVGRGELLNWTVGLLKARILKWFAIAFSSEPCFIRTLHHDPSVLGEPTGRGS